MSEINEKLSLPPDLYARNTIVAFLAGKICANKKPAILDVGGYKGKLSWFFKEYSKFIILDRKGKPKDETCDYRQADAKKIPFSDRNFDLVVAMDLLEHVPKNDRRQVIKELLRVSKGVVLIGAPLKNGLVQTAEDQIRGQFFANAGHEHPFLIEHETIGLPEEEEFDVILAEAGARFFKVREGNLMNWYLQQLYAGTQWGANGSFDKYGFYTFYNEHLAELGHLRPPTYRTIYCVTIDGTVNESEIYAALQARFSWNTETFMQLMRLAFDDLGFIINGKKEQIALLASDLKAKEDALAASEQKNRQTNSLLEETVTKARKGIEAYRRVVLELRDLLREKEHALNLVRSILKNQENKLEEANRGIAKRDDFIKKLNLELEGKMASLDKLRNHVHRVEKLMQESKSAIAAKEQENEALRKELDAHGKALAEVLNSRAWKAVMVYSSLKQATLVRPARALTKAYGILIKLGPKVFLRKLARKLSRSRRSESGEYEKYIADTEITPAAKKEMMRHIREFNFKPLISIVMPVFNVDERWLIKSVESVKAQVYEKWELCVCDDGSSLPHVRPLLERFSAEDQRIRVIYRQKNGGIVKASNAALALASGAYVGLLDHDDTLSPDALYRVVEALQEKKYDLIYSDEDKLEAGEKRCEPFFKPDWSPDLLLSCNYISHFGVYRRKILTEIGGFREGYDGSQDYDLVLRFTEKTQEIKHIPRILYHWRKVKGSAAESVEAKPYAYEAAKRALVDAVRRRKMNATVEDGLWAGSYRVRRAITGRQVSGTASVAYNDHEHEEVYVTGQVNGMASVTNNGLAATEHHPAEWKMAPRAAEPLVSIIIPFKDKIDLLDRCLRGIYEKSTWKNFEVLLVDNDSELLATAEYLEKAPSNFPNLNLLNFQGRFNYSAINNFAARQAKGDYLVLLNNDTEVISPDWIESMLEHAQRGEVGAVGAKLLFEDGTVQHAGVIMGLGGLAGHAFSRQTDLDHGYSGLIDVVRNYSAVTAACLMSRKEVYFEVGGLDETNLGVAFNDVDFCLKLRQKKYLIVYTPYAVLKHYESSSRGYEVDLNEIALMQRRYAGLLANGDPYYNPNLTLERPDFSMRVFDKVK